MPSSFNKKIVGQNFSNAVSSYNQAASTQRLAAEKLCQLAFPFLQDGAQVLDLGAGTGFISEFLSEKNLQIFECDLSLNMLRVKNDKNVKIQCDFENLPFKNHSFDILISSFSLQWLSDFEKNFTQFFNLLKPNGIFIFCLPTNNSLHELKSASAASNCNFHFNILPKNSELKSALKNSGFNEKFQKSEIFKSEFSNATQALRSIKKTGANYFGKKNFIAKSQLEQFNNFCLKNFASRNKTISISWDISFFILTKPNKS